MMFVRMAGPLAFALLATISVCAAFAAEGQYAAFAGPAIDVDASELWKVGKTDPLGRLARGEIPAIILRRTLSTADCKNILQQCYDANQFPASFVPFIPSVNTGMVSGVEAQRDVYDVPEAAEGDHGAPQHGVYDVAEIQEAGDIVFASMANASTETQPLATRSDIGYSLAGGGNHPETYFPTCAKVHELYDELLAPFPPHHNPMHLMYEALEVLGNQTRKAVTAHESRGRYGPGIIRTHKPGFHHGRKYVPGHTYVPHYDSVRLRERRSDFEVFKFDNQLAGILVLQAPERIARPAAESGDVYHDSILYNMPAKDLPAWNLTQATARGFEVLEGDVGPASGMDVHPPSFRQFIRDHPVAKENVDLEVGDMYFFKTDNVHEAPPFEGKRARVVFGTFVGYGEEQPEMFVWS